MSTTAGYFDETILNDIRVRAAQIAFDDRVKQQYVADYEVINAIKAVQTANIYPSLARRKDVDVEVIWQNVCGQEVEDNTTCVIGGAKSSTNLKEYSLSYEKVVNFSEDEADYTDNEFEIQENIAKQFLVADKNLTENFAQYCVSQIEAFRGWNTTDPEGKGDITGADTYIAPVYWNPSLTAYFMRAAKMNKFTAPVFLSGYNLYESMYVASANAANANGKGDSILYNQLRMFFDLHNVDSVTDPLLKTYMLSTGSLAMAYRARNPMNPDRTDVFTRWQMKSQYLPFYYDVYYTTECTTDDLIQHNFKIKLTADLFNNPTGCDDNNTGVLSFVCGTPS
jgi:hypothetical protein